MKKYINGTKVPKKALASLFLHKKAIELAFGLRAMHPRVQGNVETRYEIMKTSCQSWSSVDVT